jgi:hypothetical protein
VSGTGDWSHWFLLAYILTSTLHLILYKDLSKHLGRALAVVTSILLRTILALHYDTIASSGINSPSIFEGDDFSVNIQGGSSGKTRGLPGPTHRNLARVEIGPTLRTRAIEIRGAHADPQLQATPADPTILVVWCRETRNRSDHRAVHSTHAHAMPSRLRLCHSNLSYRKAFCKQSRPVPPSGWTRSFIARIER